MTKTDMPTITAGAAVSSLSEELRETTDADHAFFVTVALCELLRRLKNPKPATQDVKKQVQAIIDFLTALVNNNALDNWNKINFSLTQHLLGSTYDARLLSAGISHAEIPVAMTAALSLFVDRVVHSPETLELRVATVNDMAQSVEAIFGAVTEEEPAPEAKAVEPPPLFDTYARPPQFSSPKITYELLSAINAEFISYRTTMPTGELGPQILGLSLEGPDGKLRTFLETGEYLVLERGALFVATHTDPQDIKLFPPCLLLYAKLAADTLYGHDMLTPEQHTLLSSSEYGEITVPNSALDTAANADDVAPIEAMLKIDPRSVAVEAARPIVIDFQVDETKLVRLSGVYAKNGSYVAAKLVEQVDGKEKTRLVHTVPRLFTARGVYVFPLSNSNEFVSLTIIN